MLAAALAAAAVLQAGRLVEAPPATQIVRPCWCSRIFRSPPTGRRRYFQQTLTDLTDLTREIGEHARRQARTDSLARVASPVFHERCAIPRTDQRDGSRDRRMDRRRFDWNDARTDKFRCGPYPTPPRLISPSGRMDGPLRQGSPRSLSANICRFPACSHLPEDSRRKSVDFEHGDIAQAAQCWQEATGRIHLLRVCVSRRCSPICQQRRAGFREHLQRRLVWRQRRVCPAFEPDPHARDRE